MRLKKQVIVILICASLVASTMIVTRTVHADTLNVPTPYTTIQSAIDAANPLGGDTIVVAPGVYNEQILIDVPVTITGAGAGTTTITGAGLTAGTPVVTIDAAGNVSFSGFTITGAPFDATPESFGMVAKQSVPTLGVTYTISDCRFVGTNTPANNGEFQFYETGGQEDVVFTRNVVTTYSGNAFVSEQHNGATEISYCSFDAPLCNTPGNPADVIFFMTYNGLNNGFLQNISYNTFNMGTAAQKSTAVTISAPGAGVGNAVWSNVLIEGNAFNNLLANGRAVGFWATGGPNIIDAVVTKNYIAGTGGVGSYGIGFYDDSGGLTIGTTIGCNTITGMDVGIILRHVSSPLPDAPNTVIVNNNIFGNTIGLDWNWLVAGGVPVAAVNNWWGSASGPGGVGPGTGDPVTGGVVFSPWLYALAQWPSLYTNPTQVNKAPSDVGTDFTVAVTLSNFTNLMGFGINMTWDDSLIAFVSADATPLNSLWSGGWTTVRNQAGVGYYDFAASSTDTAGSNTGASILFNVRFQVAKSWTSELSTPIHFALTDLSDNTTPTPSPILPIVTDGTYTMSAMAPGLVFRIEKRNKWTGNNVTIDPPYDFESLDYFHVDVYVTEVVSLVNYSLTVEFTTGVIVFQGVEYWGIFGEGDVSYTPGGSVIEVSGSGSAWSGSEGLLCKLTFYVDLTVPDNIWKYGSSNSVTHTILITDASLGFGLGIIPMSELTMPSDLTIEVDFIRGDVDCNGVVNMADISYVAFYYGKPAADNPEYDLTNSGIIIDIYDIVTIATNYGYGTNP